MSDIRLYPLSRLTSLAQYSDKAMLVVTEGTGSAADAAEVAAAIGTSPESLITGAQAMDAAQEASFRAAIKATSDDLGEADYINSQPGTAAKVVSSAGPPRVARMGDSLTENGGFPPGPNMSIIGQFGRGFTVTAGSTPTNNADYQHWMFGGSLNGNSKQILAGSTVEMSCGNPTATPIRGDRFSFYYLTVPGSGTFDLQSQAVDGSWTNIQTGINADGALAGQVIAGTLSSSSTPSYKLRVTNVTGAGFAFIGAGIYQQHGTGIIWLGDMLANGGVDFPNPLTTPSAVYTPILRDLSPDLILSCWADDAAEWAADGDFQTLMDRIDAATTFTVASFVTTNNSASVTFPANFQIQPGMLVTGTGIPVGTRIRSITSTTAATLSSAATASGTITATLQPQTDYVQVSAHPLTVASASTERAGLAIQREWAIRNKQTYINMFDAFRGDAQWMADMGFKSSADDAHLTTAGGGARWHHLWSRLPVGVLPLGAFYNNYYGELPPISMLGGPTNPANENIIFNRTSIFSGTNAGVTLANRSSRNNLLSAASLYSDSSEFFISQNNSVFAISGQSSILGWHPPANGRMLGSRGDFKWRIGATGIQTEYRGITADYTLTADDFTVNVTSGSPNITLPTATAASASTGAAQNIAAGLEGRIFVITNNGAGVATIIGTVSGVTNPTVAAGARMWIQSTGTGYIRLDNP